MQHLSAVLAGHSSVFLMADGEQRNTSYAQPAQSPTLVHGQSWHASFSQWSNVKAHFILPSARKILLILMTLDVSQWYFQDQSVSVIANSWIRTGKHQELFRYELIAGHSSAQLYVLLEQQLEEQGVVGGLRA